MDDMDDVDKYNWFFSDLHGFAADSEELSKMLATRIEFLLDEFFKISFDSDDCLNRRVEIEKTIDSYQRSIEAYCLFLKEKYRWAFNRVDPKVIEKLRTTKVVYEWERTEQK